MPLNNITAAQLEFFPVVPPAYTTPGAAATWENWDVSAVIPSTAKFVEVLIKVGIRASMQVGVRNDGSSVEHKDPSLGLQRHITMTCGVTSQVIERYAQETAYAAFTLLGYWK